MTLLELCDPLFKEICLINRSARKGAALDPAQVESDVEAILANMKSKARSNPGLADQYEKIEMPLLFFVDNVICTGNFDLANNWNRLAYKRDRVTGDTDFCDEVDKALSEPESVSANERLAVYYTCMGLGFTGDRFEDPSIRQQRMTQIARRIRAMTELEDRARITPDAYTHTLQDDLVPPPVGPVWKIAIALVGLIIVLIVMNGFLYRDEIKGLNDTLGRIQTVGQEAQK
jgi:type VI secretion system protein ImpK